MNLKLLGIAIFINSILLVVLSFQILSLRSLQKTQVPILSPVPQITPSPALHTYRNDQYGFEFQYPSSLKVSDDFSNRQQITLINKLQNTKSTSFFSINLPDEFHLSVRDTNKNQVIVGANTFKYYSVPSDSPWYSYEIKNGDSILTIDTSEPNLHLTNQDFIQILSTFKFTNLQPSSSTPTPAPSVDSLHLNSPTAKIGFIKDSYTKNGMNYIDIDYVEFLYDTPTNNYAGTKACVKDGKCQEFDSSCEIDQNKNCVPSEWSFCNGTKCATTRCGVDKSCLPNGYYIQNNNSQLRTLEISTTAQIYCLNIANAANTVLLNPSEVEKVISATYKSCFWGDLFRIDFDKSGKINWMIQVYTP